MFSFLLHYNIGENDFCTIQKPNIRHETKEAGQAADRLPALLLIKNESVKFRNRRSLCRKRASGQSV